MQRPRTFYNILLIFTFIYLMMCPVVHKLFSGHIDQNVIVKVEEERAEKHTNKHSRYMEFGLSFGNPTDILSHFKASTKTPFLLSSNTTPCLLILSTIRLIL